MKIQLREYWGLEKKEFKDRTENIITSFLIIEVINFLTSINEMKIVNGVIILILMILLWRKVEYEKKERRKQE